jgi:hypothetical protein
MFVDESEGEEEKQVQKVDKPETHTVDTVDCASMAKAKAVAHEEYPDTYNLWIKGVKKGYAAVQDLDLSRELRLASKEGAELFVNVEWNSEFNMYEIVSKA